MEEPELLAKSLKDKNGLPRFEETLWGHTVKTMESFEVMFGAPGKAPTRLASRWLAFFGLSDSAMEAFLVNGRAACGLHDLGKGTGFFQDMLRGLRAISVLRHEHLSGIFLWLPDVASWLDAIPLLDRKIVFCAIAGHHLRCKREDFAQPLEDLKSFRLLPDGICALFNKIGVALGAPFEARGEMLVSPLWSLDGRGGFDLKAFREDALHQMGRFHRRELKKDPFRARLLMGVRAALILADSSGSGLAREEKDLSNWLETAFGEPLSASYVEANVIARRVDQIERSKGRFQWSDFQDAAEGIGPRGLLLAPCGSGKTLAAWRWIKARLKEQPAARVIFLYPTRATATEGFRDYVSWAPEADASLLTGTAAYELEGMFESPDDDRSSKSFTVEDRLYALGYWHRRVFSATVDQFLGFMQHVYRSVCLMPLLADSVVVIDEVHSFDRSLFSALKLFLKSFHVPVLCMTASLTPLRRKELVEECGLTAFPASSEAFPALEAGATMERYRVGVLEDEAQATSAALNARDSGKKILWVVNTVVRCQALARSLGALCYHSRFKLEDRKARHTDIIEAFQSGNEPVLAITTQVCEMSLDLDADVLISETAPITALIQRMGRCNRHATPGSGKVGEVFFYMPVDELPYSADDLAGSSDFTTAMAGRTVNQATLEELLEQFGTSTFEPERYAAFLENGPWAVSRESGLRDANDFSVTAILTEDVGRYFEMKRQQKATDGLYLPVPRKNARKHPRLGAFPQVAESSHYDPMFGFFDHPLEVIL